MTPAEEFRSIRLALGLTQKQVAERLGVTRVSVIRWENGKAKIAPPVMFLMREWKDKGNG